MIPIQELPQFKQDCKRFQDAISKLTSDDDKSRLTSLYNDFLVKVASVDRLVTSSPAEFKEISFTHKTLISEMTRSKIQVENFIKKHLN